MLYSACFREGRVCMQVCMEYRMCSLTHRMCSLTHRMCSRTIECMQVFREGRVCMQVCMEEEKEIKNERG